MINLRPEVFNLFLDSMKNFRYVILRNYEELPKTSNDIDILIEKNKINIIKETLINNFALIDVVFIRQSRFVCYSLYFYDKIEMSYFHLDFFDELSWRSFDYLCSKKILEERIQHKNIYIPKPKDEFIELLLTRLVMEKKVKEKYRTKILSYFQNYKNEILLDYNYWIKPITNYLINGNFNKIDKKWLIFRIKVILNSIKMNKHHQVKKTYHFIKRIVNRFIDPPGVLLMHDFGRSDLEKLMQSLKKLEVLYPEKIVILKEKYYPIAKIKFMLFKDYLIITTNKIKISKKYKIISLSSGIDDSIKLTKIYNQFFEKT